MKTFKASYSVKKEAFSDYHYMVVSPSKEFYYDKPVIVLINSGCFSASDIFAAGIKEGDNVKLLGVKTAGGSGYSKSRVLPNAKIKVKRSRIVSYQADGSMYDGHGVLPDIKIEESLSDQLGQTDSQMKAALEYFKEFKN